MTYFNQMF